jgi:uncharacterized protein (DUF305 family)
MSLRSLASVSVLLISIATSGAIAQMKMEHSQKAGSSSSPSTRGYNEAMTKMHQDMAIKYTGDADTDFVKGMIPHHQGAIDMAKVELQYGKDPENRKLAEDIIKAQDSEIAQMQDWLKKHGK